MTKIKNIKQLLQKLEKFNNAKDVIDNLNIDIDTDIIDKSKHGFIYERLWDICIKFGIVKHIITFDNDKNKLLHIDNNINELIILEKELFKEFKDIFDNYLKTNIQSGKSGGYSDITFRNNNEIILSSSKYF